MQLFYGGGGLCHKELTLTSEFELMHRPGSKEPHRHEWKFHVLQSGIEDMIRDLRDLEIIANIGFLIQEDRGNPCLLRDMGFNI